MGQFRRPTASELTTLAVIGDPHIPRASEDTLKLFQPDVFLERAVADVNARSVDGTLFVGDLTADGFEEEFDRFDRIIEALDAPWTAIPGNHDVWKTFDDHDSPPKHEFEARYTPAGIPFATSYRGIDLLALNSAALQEVNDSHDGLIGPDQIAWLDDELSRATNLVVTLHHPLPSMMSQFDEHRDALDLELSRPPILRNPEPLIDTLLDHDVPLVLTGHLHIPSIAEIDALREINAPATSTFPPAYLIIEIGPSGTVIRYVPLGNTGEMGTAFSRRSKLKPKSQALTGMASARVASFPLIDEEIGQE
jgi:predicted MPP superfamily phosphohydrolase